MLGVVRKPRSHYESICFISKVNVILSRFKIISSDEKKINSEILVRKTTLALICPT